jgi:putative tryptophan/tyrosine transport system substrate-binding protein
MAPPRQRRIKGRLAPIRTARVGRRGFITLMAGAAITWPLASRAQQSEKMYRIGGLTAGGPFVPELRSVFPDALRNLGWVEGKNITFERRFAEDRLDRLPELAAELVRLKVDLITASGTLAPLAAKRATSTIPIVMTSAGDPLGSGLVANLARPGGNVTGLSLMVPDIGGKRLELLRELLPSASRVAILWNAANPYPAAVFRETEKSAKTLDVHIQSVEVRGPDDFVGAFEIVKRDSPDALITVEDPLTIDYRKQIIDTLKDLRLPAIHGVREFVGVGGLMSYGASIADLVRRSAGYVDKILRGAKPGDLPVQQPTKFELLINLKTAKALGLTIPPSLLARADEVIE